MAKQKEKLLTREDVLKAIEENGGTAKGLDLSGKHFKTGIRLSKLFLPGIILKKANLKRARLKKAHLMNAHLEGADLLGAYLEEAALMTANLEEANLGHAHLEGAILEDAHLEGAILWDAHLEGANLLGAHLEGANLSAAHLEETNLRYARLEGAHLSRIEFPRDTKMEGADWGNYILGEEKGGLSGEASDTYRRLKIWYTEHGLYDVAGEFFFMEMEAKRKSMKWRPQPWHKGWLNIYSFISGHGERPLKVVRWAALWILGLALIYFLIGTTWSLRAFWDSFYFSMVSFTALGYGSWLNNIDNELIKGIGALNL